MLKVPTAVRALHTCHCLGTTVVPSIISPQLWPMFGQLTRALIWGAYTSTEMHKPCFRLLRPMCDKHNATLNSVQLHCTLCCSSQYLQRVSISSGGVAVRSSDRAESACMDSSHIFDNFRGSHLPARPACVQNFIARWKPGCALQTPQNRKGCC